MSAGANADCSDTGAGNHWYEYYDPAEIAELDEPNGVLIEEVVPFLFRHPERLEEAAETWTYRLDATDLAAEAPTAYDDLLDTCPRGDAATYHSTPEEAIRDLCRDPGLLSDALAFLDAEGYDTSDLDDPVAFPDGVPDIVVVNPTDEMLLDIHDGNTDHIGSRVWANGICTQTSSISPRLTEARLICDACGNFEDRDALDVFQISELEKARPCEECGAAQMKLSREKSTLEDYQQLKLQEPPEAAADPQNPASIKVELVGDDLVGNVHGGDRVTSEGILSQFTGGDSTVFETFIEGNEIRTDQSSFDSLNLTDADIERIEEFAERDDAFDAFVANLAPHIVGHERKKEAIILQLVGGNAYGEGENRRGGEIHILFIGDPSTGKSDLLKAAHELAPLSNKTSGAGATGVGLTATAVREEVAGETTWVAKAGPVVLSDGGLVAIDEFDKVRDEDRSKLNDFFADGKIHVDKADIHTTMNARAAALVTANPVSGSFDRYADDLVGQFNLDADLLSRFDLRFPFFDTADEDLDEEIIRRIGKNRTDDGLDAADQLDKEFMRKYIAYARQNVHPETSEAATDLIADFYATYRNELASENGETTLDTRSGRSLYKLAEASARFRLSDTVEVQDARRACGMFAAMLDRMHATGNGTYDITSVAGLADECGDNE